MKQPEIIMLLDDRGLTLRLIVRFHNENFCTYFFDYFCEMIEGDNKNTKYKKSFEVLKISDQLSDASLAEKIFYIHIPL